ncbi:hypothetical protein DL96DRAFT_1786537 [Flagelloscypha sp. PMI_526]|nr:hypothetical protein DL96DRAFT_1786537 [Flagelloscypha sp. PMI_526]
MSVEYLAVLKASYDYSATGDDEIEVKEGQLLFLLERTDEDWWKVKVKSEDQDNAPAGLVPAAYVEQAEHSSTVKALYDYDAAAPGELSIKEDDILLAFDSDEEWLLVQSEKDGKAGYVPANYVEEDSGETAPAPPAAPTLVIPEDPPKPSAPYVDPAERVAATKSRSDDPVKIWSVTNVDAKNKKKKGTLGAGNGAVYFASDSDKTPVQQWLTADIKTVSVEKNKHIHLSIGGSKPADLQFTVTKDIADEIVAKLKLSKSLSAPAEPEPEAEPEEAEPEPEPTKVPKSKASVHFSQSGPTVIPAAPAPDTASEESEAPGVPPGDDGELAVVLYDFAADGGDDELPVSEGEQLLVIDKDDQEWWKCRNVHGAEGVVPATYIEISGATNDDSDDAEDPKATAAAAKAAEEAAAAQREAEEKLAKQKAKEKAEAAERAKRAAEAQKQAEEAQAARLKRQAEAKARAKPVSPPPRTATPPEENPSRAEKEEKRDKDRSSSSKSRSAAGSKPPPEKVRVWHDRSGQFRVEAMLIEVRDGKVSLHKTNGVVVQVPTEKMSADDMRYIEKLAQRERALKERKSRHNDDDDLPLAEAKRRSMADQQKKKKPTIDWFEFFLNAGCDVDDCTRYSSSFERDKMDYAILPDITDGTLRSLGLREGDIIRVTKFINEKFKKDSKAEQIKKDEEYARSLQGKDTAPAPNLFASANGELKAPRRGRPTPKGSTPSVNMDLISLDNNDQVPRSGSPAVMTPTKVTASSSAPQPAKTGFDDEAWTNRPSSTKPGVVASPPPAQTTRAPSAPPAAQAPEPKPEPVVAAATAASPNSLANKTESDIFDQLARLSELRKNTPQPQPPAAPAQPAISAAPSFSTPSPGMGSGQVSTPMGQIQTPPISAPSPPTQPYNGPRGPYAPLPANEALLRPLVPTQTGFSGVPAPPPPQGPIFIQTGLPGGGLAPQPTGFPSMMSPPNSFSPSMMTAQPTGFSPSMMNTQPTGMPMGGMNNMGMGMSMNGMNGMNGSGFGLQPNPTGFNPGFGQMGGSFGQSPPPVPPLPASPPPPNTNPANIFAQMKSGTFANDNAAQPPEKYDALRPNPGVYAQPTGYYGGFR